MHHQAARYLAAAGVQYGLTAASTSLLPATLGTPTRDRLSGDRDSGHQHQLSRVPPRHLSWQVGRDRSYFGSARPKPIIEARIAVDIDRPGTAGVARSARIGAAASRSEVPLLAAQLVRSRPSTATAAAAPGTPSIELGDPRLARLGCLVEPFPIPRAPALQGGLVVPNPRPPELLLADCWSEPSQTARLGHPEGAGRNKDPHQAPGARPPRRLRQRLPWKKHTARDARSATRVNDSAVDARATDAASETARPESSINVGLPCAPVTKRSARGSVAIATKQHPQHPVTACP